MSTRLRPKHLSRFGIMGMFILATLISSATVFVKSSEAVGFSMQSGYYVGTGVAGKVISGLGFQPQYMTIKAVSAQVAIMKTSTMPADSTAVYGPSALATTSAITFTADGFTLSTAASVNNVNTLFYWTAFAGSDCSATGTMCVGTYNGDATAGRTISVGFQPNLVINRRSTAVATHFRTSSMPAGRSEYFTTSAANTTGAFLNTFTASGFTVGASDNASGAIYHYVAFKSSVGTMATGSYAGDAVDDRSITGVGFKPDVVVIKNSTSATTANLRSVTTSSYQPTNDSQYYSDGVVDAVNLIQRLDTDGFQIGTAGEVNETGATIYWFAFAGVPTDTGSGEFQMATGSYAGNSAVRSFTGLGFQPDLIILKNISTGYMIYRTSLQKVANAGYLGNGAVDFSNGITSLDADGFSVGTNAVANTTGNTYHWQAFGNAYDPETKTGSANFTIGAYMSNAVDDTEISRLPFKPDFLAIKSLGATPGVFRISDQSGDLSSFFSAAAESDNIIQSLNTNGFTVGTNASVNISGSTRLNWFAFKNSPNFTSGTYTGDGVGGRSLTVGSGFTPELIWIKQSTGVNGVTRPSTLASNANQYFMNIANATTNITGVTATGVTLSSNFEVNSSGGIYRYVAWKVPPIATTLSGDIVTSAGVSISNPTLAMSSLSYPFTCTQSTGVLGSTNQKIRILNTTATATWTTSIAATAGSTALWRNGGNTQQYDYNESSGSPAGCSDGSDTDSKAGVLRIEPIGATITPQAGCTSTGLTLGSNTDFNESTVNAITLITASIGAGTNCYWDITGINLKQYVPEAQAGDNYALDLTITTISS